MTAGYVSTTRTHGSDCSRGPGCCCNPCVLTRLGCTPIRCCRCIPLTMCIRHMPDDIYDCAEVSVLMDWEGASLSRYRPTRLLGYDYWLSLGGPDEYGTCFWELKVYVRATEFYIGDLIFNHNFPIIYNPITCDDPYGYGYGYGNEITCQNPVIPFRADEPGLSCPGEVTISRFEMERATFRKIVFDPPESEVELYEPVCGDCDKPCRYICVEYNTIIDGEDDEEDIQVVHRRNFEWKSDHDHPAGWYDTRCDVEDSITLVENEYEYGGGCKLLIDIADLAGTIFADTRLLDSPCGIGMRLQFTGSLGHYIKVSCGPCTCWKHICGTCRCVCRTLCVGRDDGSAPDSAVYEELEWDDERSRWGDDDYAITLEDDGCGGCQARVPGYDDPFPIDSCGRGITIFSEQDEYGKFVTATCKTCLCGRPVGCCGDLPMPVLWYVDITSPPSGSAQLYECFEALAVPIVYVPTGVEFDLKWQGNFSFIGSCGDTVTGTVKVECIGASDFIATVTIATGEGWTLAASSVSCGPLLVEFPLTPGSLAGPTGPPFCVECTSGISILASE